MLVGTMTRIRLALLSIAIPALCAVSAEQPFDGVPRQTLEKWLDVLMEHCDQQVEEIAAFLTPEETQWLRSEHDAWKQFRDDLCAELARGSSGELRELECQARLTGDYFDRLEVEISKLEAQAAARSN
jgi:hypothetical protein